MQILPLRLVFALVCMIVVLSGCLVKLPLTHDGAALKPDEGLVAFHVSSAQAVSLSYVDYSAEASPSMNELAWWGPKGLIMMGSFRQFVVLPLTQGEYMFSRVAIGDWVSHIEARNRFKVTAKKITYLGHFWVAVEDKRLRFWVYDQELPMREFLVGTYPAYFQSMDVQKNLLETNPQ